MVLASVTTTCTAVKYGKFIIFILLAIQLMMSPSLAIYAPMQITFDPYIASEYRSLYIQNVDDGPVNITFDQTFPQGVLVTTTSYKILTSMSCQVGYQISGNRISISVQVQKVDITYVRFYVYTDEDYNFYQNLNLNLLIIDEMSQSYPYVMPSVQRFNGISLYENSSYVDVLVTSFNPQDLNIDNDLVIYSFLTGFVIISINTNFQLQTYSQILDAGTIRVSLYSDSNLLNVDWVRIDTVVVDVTQIQFTKYVVLDFQTVDYQSDQTDTIWFEFLPAYFQNMFTGISQFHIIDQQFFYFYINWGEGDYIVYDFNDFNFQGCYFSDMIFSNLNFVSKICPEGYPYFYKALQLCFDTDCPAGNYRKPFQVDCQLNNSCQTCIPCIYSCQTCQNSMVCLTCNQLNFRNFSLTNQLCEPIQGYFDDGLNNPIAQPCHSSCLACLGSAENCTICNTPLYFQNLTDSTCLLCSSLILGCKYCLNQSICQECQSGQPPITANFCGFCGDGYFNPPDQQCDDGNNLNRDGCNSNCQIQLNFSCILNGTLSVCLYSGEVFLKINTIIKHQSKNQIFIKIIYGPAYLLAWKQVNLIEIFGTSIPYSHIDLVQSSPGVLSLVLDYTQDVSQRSQNFTLTPSDSGLLIFSNVQPSKVSQTMVSANNQGIYYYSDQVYSLQAIFDKIALIATILALLGLLLAVLGPKLIGTEMIMVFQLTFLSLLNVGDLNPGFNSLRILKITLGYSLFQDDKAVYDAYSPYQVRGASLYSQFLKNYNIIGLLVIIPLLIGLVINMLVKYSYLQKTSTLGKNGKYFLGQYTFMGLSFGACSIFSSLFIQLIYGSKDTTSAIGVLSIIFGLLISGIGIIYGVFLFRKPKMFRNYTFQSFHPNFQNKFYTCTIFLSLIVSAVMVVCIDLKFTLFFFIVIFALIFAFISIKRPYIGRGNIRSCGNILILILIWSILIVYRLSSNNFRHKGLGIYIPIFIIVGLVLCLFLNIPLLVYYTVQNFRNKKQYQQIQNQFAKQEIQYVKEKIKNSILQNNSHNSISHRNNSTSQKHRHTQITKTIPRLNKNQDKTGQRKQSNQSDIQNFTSLQDQFQREDNDLKNSLLKKSQDETSRTKNNRSSNRQLNQTGKFFGNQTSRTFQANKQEKQDKSIQQPQVYQNKQAKKIDKSQPKEESEDSIQVKEFRQEEIIHKEKVFNVKKQTAVSQNILVQASQKEFREQEIIQKNEVLDLKPQIVESKQKGLADTLAVKEFKQQEFIDVKPQKVVSQQKGIIYSKSDAL